MYGRDPDARLRGVGAIAAVDGVSRARARAQARRQQVMRVLDRRNARLAHGPGRALPVPMGAISRLGTSLLSANTPTIRTGGSIEVPPLQVTPPGTVTPPPPPPGGTLPTKPRIPIGVLTTTAPTIGTKSTMPGTGLTPPGVVVGVSSGGGPGAPIPDPTGTSVTSSTTTVPPPPPRQPTKPPPSGGGGGTWTPPPGGAPTFTPMPEVPELGPPSGGGDNKLRNLALVGAGLLGLYLLTRD